MLVGKVEAVQPAAGRGGGVTWPRTPAGTRHIIAQPTHPGMHAGFESTHTSAAAYMSGTATQTERTCVLLNRCAE